CAILPTVVATDYW
nr:immunoglobulin heavy chain junction region [Mus musculus]